MDEIVIPDRHDRIGSDIIPALKLEEDTMRDWSIKELIRINKEKDAAIEELATQLTR